MGNKLPNRVCKISFVCIHLPGCAMILKFCLSVLTSKISDFFTKWIVFMDERGFGRFNTYFGSNVCVVRPLFLELSEKPLEMPSGNFDHGFLETNPQQDYISINFKHTRHFSTAEPWKQNREKDVTVFDNIKSDSWNKMIRVPFFSGKSLFARYLNKVPFMISR